MEVCKLLILAIMCWQLVLIKSAVRDYVYLETIAERQESLLKFYYGG